MAEKKTKYPHKIKYGNSWAKYSLKRMRMVKVVGVGPTEVQVNLPTVIF